MSAIAEGVTEIIAGKSKRDPAELQGSDWLDELGIESLEVVEMIFELEDRFGVDIPVNANSAGREFKTVGDFLLRSSSPRKVRLEVGSGHGMGVISPIGLSG